MSLNPGIYSSMGQTYTNQIGSINFTGYAYVYSTNTISVQPTTNGGKTNYISVTSNPGPIPITVGNHIVGPNIPLGTIITQDLGSGIYKVSKPQTQGGASVSAYVCIGTPVQYGQVVASAPTYGSSTYGGKLDFYAPTQGKAGPTMTLINGNVGIGGKTAPLQVLDVSGSALISGNLAVGKTLAGQGLAMDISGSLSVSNTNSGFGFFNQTTTADTWYKLAEAWESVGKTAFRIEGTLCYIHDTHAIDITVSSNWTSNDLYYPRIYWNQQSDQETISLFDKFDIVYVLDTTINPTHVVVYAKFSQKFQVSLKTTAINKNGTSTTPISYPGTPYSLSFSGTMSNAVDTTLSSTLAINKAVSTFSGTVKTYITPTGTVSMFNNNITFFSSIPWLYMNHPSAIGTGNWYLGFAYNGTNIGAISRNSNTSVAYVTTSDKTLKEDLGLYNDFSKIDDIEIHKFRWKSSDEEDYGCFAQDVYGIIPKAVCIGNDTIDEQNPIKTPWGVDYSKFMPDLIVYCQQLKKTVQSLEQRLVALENK